MQGIIAPQYYGFFTAQLDFPLWKTEDFDLDVDDDDPTCDDTLPDDPYDGEINEDEDEDADFVRLEGGREHSPWCGWRHDPAAPLLAVIVKTRGGAIYSKKDDADKDNW